MLLAVLILAAGLVVLVPLALWLRQREHEAAAEAERTLGRLRRRHLALTGRIDEIARDVERFVPVAPPPAA